MIFSQHDKLFEYASSDMDQVLRRRQGHQGERDSRTNVDVR